MIARAGRVHHASLGNMANAIVTLPSGVPYLRGKEPQ
jgi:hypothetical protein